MEHLDTSLGRVAVDVSGDGPPVILLHATLHDRHDFDPIAPRLAAENTVIAVDWPGHGDSDPAPEVTAPKLAAVLEEVVAALGVGPAVLIGNSVGGYAAAKLALGRPEAVAGLVLVNAGGFSPQDPVSRSFCRALGTPSIARRAAPAVVAAYMRSASEEDRVIADRAVARIRTAEGLETFTSLWRSFNDPDHDLRTRARAITAPTMIVWGTRDRVASTRFGRAAHAAIPGSVLRTLPTGHVVFASSPDAFLAVTQPFIRSAHVRSPA